MNKLDEIRRNSEFLKLFTQAISYFYGSGVLEFLRGKSRTQPADPNSPNYLMMLAAQSEYSRGYNDALDDLLNFRERFLDVQPVSKTEPDYGAYDEAIRQGDLTEKEANELRAEFKRDITGE